MKTLSLRWRSLPALLLLAAAAWASAPVLFNFQGRLTDPDGNPVTDAAPGVPMAFRIYDGGGGLLSTYTPAAGVPVVNGAFNVAVGDLSAGAMTGLSLDAALSGAGDRYLEVVVNGAALSPRRRLAAEAYALILGDASVGTAKLVAGAVTDAKVSGVSWGKLMGVPSGFADGTDDGGLSVRMNGSPVVLSSTMDFTAPLLAVNAGGVARIGVDPSSVTLMGNSFNAGNQLVRLSGGVAPFALLGATDTLRTGVQAAWSGVRISSGAGLAGGGLLTADVPLGLDVSGFGGCDTAAATGKVYWDGARLACGADNGGSSGTVTGGGSANRLARWMGVGASTSIASASITDNGAAVGVTVGMSASGVVSSPGFFGNGSALTGVNGTTLDGVDSTGFAPSGHTHGASSFTSGILSVDRGGTGLGALSANNYVMVSGASSYALRSYAQVLSDIGAASAVHSHDLGNADITGALAVSKGGTGRSTLPSNEVLLGNGTGGVLSAGALGTGQLLAGRTGLSPVAKDLLGTANQVVVTNNAGNITLSLPQDLGTASSPSFNDVSVSGNVTGTWTGNAMDAAHGGTGRTTLTNHGVLLGAGAGAVNALTGGTTGQLLISGGAAADPVWAFVSNGHLQAGSYPGVTGVGALTAGTWNGTALAPAFGGTGQTAVAAGDLLYGTGPNAWGRLAGGASPGQVLRWNGSQPAWQTVFPGSGTVTSLSAGTGLTGGTITLSGTIALNVDTSGGGCDQTSTGKAYWNGARVVCDGDAQGGAGAVVSSGTPTAGQLAFWAAGASIGNAALSQAGGNLVIAGTVTVNGSVAVSGVVLSTAGSGGAGATWNGTSIPLNRGGTGASLPSVPGGIPYAAAGQLGMTAAGTAGQVLVFNDAAPPAWGTMSGAQIGFGYAAAAVKGGPALSAEDLVMSSTGDTVLVTGGDFVVNVGTPLDEAMRINTSSVIFNAGSLYSNELEVSDGAGNGLLITCIGQQVRFDELTGGVQTRIMTYTATSQALAVNGAVSKPGGTFEIPHPDPAKAKDGWRLRHSFVESPTRGDNLYHWTVEVKGGEGVLMLPAYFKHLNEDVQVWVSPEDMPAAAYGLVDPGMTRVAVKAEADGLYDVLVIGTRKDQAGEDAWDPLGPEYRP